MINQAFGFISCHNKNLLKLLHTYLQNPRVGNSIFGKKNYKATMSSVQVKIRPELGAFQVL